jgi:hypothetical protein
MATLDNPINPQNIVNRYSDYVTAVANAQIAWGTNAKPFEEMDVAFFGGTNAGRAIGITGTSIGEVDTVITALNIYNTLVTETALYTNIRNLRATLNVEGGGGNTGSRGTPGIIIDTTGIAHMGDSYRQSIGTPDASNVSSGNEVTSANLQQFFTNLATSYNTARETLTSIQTNVCHASCHSSCHSSRGRR